MVSQCTLCYSCIKWLTCLASCACSCVATWYSHVAWIDFLFSKWLPAHQCAHLVFLLPPVGAYKYSMASAAAMDPRVVWEEYLWQKAQLKETYTGYQLVKARAGATKAELEIIYKLLSTRLHPDKTALEEWVEARYPDQMDQDLFLQLKDHQCAFWVKWMAEKEKLEELDEGLFKQACNYIVHVHKGWHCVVGCCWASWGNVCRLAGLPM